MVSNKTAIVIFVRPAAEERKYKRLAATASLNKQLFERLNKRVTALAKKTGLPFFVVEGTPQQGISFKDKLSFSIQGFFNAGYQHLLVLGNDCCSLNLPLLTKAIGELEAGRNVLGPDTNGGVYLIGLQKESFSAAGFKDCRWQTSFLFTDISAVYQESGLYVLPEQPDLNNLADAARTISDARLSSCIRNFVAGCIAVFRSYKNKYRLLFKENGRLPDLPLRAPPAS